MKKNIDTKKLLFENMEKLNPDFKLNEELSSMWSKDAKHGVYPGYTPDGREAWSVWVNNVMWKTFADEKEANDKFAKLTLNESDDKWIQKAVDPEHKGYCTPMTKPTCTPKRKALAKRFKKGIENESVDFNLLGGQYKDNVTKQAEEIKAKIDAWLEEGEDDAINAIHSFLMRKGKPFPLSPEEIKEVFDKLYENGRQ
jgi:hypothetical protein